MYYSKRTIPWNDIGLLTTILIWAGNFSIVKQSFASMPPLAFNSIRFFFVPILMLSIVWFVEKSISIERSLWRDAIFVGLIGNAGYQVFFMIGLSLTSAATSALLIATTPIWIALISQIRGVEQLSRTGWIGVFISFIGVFVILFDGAALSTNNIIGNVLILVSSMCWAYYTIGAKSMLAKYSPLRVTAVTLTIGGIPLILIGLSEVFTVNWLAVPWQGWAGMAYSVVLSVALAYILWYNGVVKVGPTRTGIYASLLPAAGVISAYFILGDPITIRDMIGTVAIVGGLLLTRRG